MLVFFIRRNDFLKEFPTENNRFRKVVIIPLKDELGDHSWKEFIKPIVVKSFKDKKMVLFHESAIWIEEHFLEQIKELLPEIEVTITGTPEDI